MKEVKQNPIRLKFESRSVNEAFARAAAGAYLMAFDPTLEELSDIKTAVSEAVTNAIVHAYADCIGEITMDLYTKEGRTICIRIVDKGCGIPNVKPGYGAAFYYLFRCGALWVRIYHDAVFL